MKRKDPPKTLVLHGVYFIIAGIILMLFPLNYLDHMGGLYSDLADFCSWPSGWWICTS